MDSSLKLDVPGDEAFRHMVDVVLPEIRISQKAYDHVQSWLTTFKTFLSDLTPFESHSVDWLSKVKVPLPRKIYPSNVVMPFKWVEPTSVDIMGSYAMNTAVEKVSEADIFIEMPKESLSKSDLINHKYHIKRALYLSYIAENMDGDEEMNFICPDGNPLKPILEVQVAKDLHVRLHVIPPLDFFKVSRLLPDKNNLRFRHFYPNSKCQESESTAQSTSHYNNSIAADILLRSNLDFMQTILEKSKVYRETVMLLKVWLQQRNLNQGYGSFSNFIMTAFVCHLIQTNKITSTMGIYQIMRVVMLNLSTAEWNSKGICFEKCSKEDIKNWHLHSSIVFLDETGTLNFTSNMFPLTFKRVKIEATEVLKNLNQVNLVNFQWIFMRKVPFLNTFDHILQITKMKTLEKKLRSQEDLQWTT